MSGTRYVPLLRLFAVGAVALACSTSLQAKTFYIEDGDVQALQAALNEAATNGEEDVIDLQDKVVTLTEPQPDTQSGIVVQAESFNGNRNTNHIRIQNGTIERSTAPGTPDFRLVEVKAPPGAVPDFYESVVFFDNMVLRNGQFNAGNVSTSSSGGGAILADWQVTLVDSSVQNNSVLGNGTGGAVRATDTLGIFNSEFIGNTAVSSFSGTTGRGGAVYTNSRSLISNTLFSGNRADAGGAVFDDVFSDDEVYIMRSLFSGNTATNLGGGIWSRSKRLRLENSTLTGNRGSGGAAFYSQRPQGGNLTYKVSVEFSTIVNNVATSGSGGAGILSAANFPSGLRIISSIIGGNTVEVGNDDPVLENCAVINNAASIAPITSSISDDGSCDSSVGGMMRVDSMASVVESTLASNGGLTQTLALTTNSPAIDASTADSCPGVDQRLVQRNTDMTGNACDIGAYEQSNEDVMPTDSDGDGIPDEAVDGQLADNCPAIANADQQDFDQDGLGDVCDADRDGDGVPQFDPETEAADNCPSIPNTTQQDTDEDGLGDVCDGTPDGDDADGDGIGDVFDNCPGVASTNLLDTDNDGEGNVCDDDDDGDGVPDVDDAFPLDPTQSTLDQDEDGVSDDDDNCPLVSNADQLDTDNDGEGNVCDDDDDGDGVPDVDDAYPLDPSQTVLDQDGDGVSDDDDNCPAIGNADQADADEDGLGDVCDDTDDTDDDVGTGINSDITAIAGKLDALVAASSSRQIRSILNNASRRLGWALHSRYWTAENELSKRYGAQVFTYVSQAVNEMERIADWRFADADLRAGLDALTSSLLDDMRSLAEQEVQKATAEGGSRWRIARANIALQLGDRDRNRDRLSSATRDYGLAWRWASSAYR